MAGIDPFDDDLDFSGFFDQIDDIVQFPTDNNDGDLRMGSINPTDNNCDLRMGSIIPADNNCGLGMGSADPPSGLLNPDPILPDNHSSYRISDLSTQLSVPYEDIIQLEWLSNFVEDSFAVGDDMMTLMKSNFPVKNESPQNIENSTTGSSSSTSSCSVGKAISLPLPQRARTKRPRPSPSIPAISPTSSFTGPIISGHMQFQSDNFADFKTDKMMKNKKMVTKVHNHVVKKCMHCEITRTPQWRAGPMGPKTLCNACGVRYKSGRLFPEYRPAASPTFIPNFHSNSHKKVVEMRATKVVPFILTGLNLTGC